MRSFSNVLQPAAAEIKTGDHPFKGDWRKSCFRNNNPIVLELGCGKGEYTIALALKSPEKNHIGIDIKGARIWRGAKTAIEKNIPNVIFLRTRIEFLNAFFSDEEVNEIWITFPDPFPKVKNINRRLTSPWFLNLYRLILKNNGMVHLKTDNLQLYKFTLDTIQLNNLEIISSTDDLYAMSGHDDILSTTTHYEKLFLKDGKKICYLSFLLPREKVIKNVCGEEKSE